MAQLRRTESVRHLERGWPFLALLLASSLALLAPLTAGADPEAEATIAPALFDAAQAAPSSSFSVIVQGDAGTEAVAAEVESAVEEEGRTEEAAATAVEDSFVTVPGVSATLTGNEILALAESTEPLEITLDAPLTAADLPTNTELPTIQGSAVERATLSVDVGAWSGTPPLSYAFQWQRCAASGLDCQDIAGATGADYTLAAADVGAAIRLLVQATGSEGSAMAVSAPTAIVAAAAAPVVAPTNAAEPQVSGLAEPGQVLTTTDGAWEGGGELAYSYQWQRCNKDDREVVVGREEPLGFWRFSERSGDVAADSSGHELNGSYVGELTYAVGGVAGEGSIGVGLRGTGTVDVPGLSPGAFSEGFSLEVWVDTAAPQTDRAVLAHWLPGEGGVMLRLDEAGNYGLVAGEQTILRTAVAPSGWWEHLVATWDGSTLRLYRNATLIGSEPFSGALGQPDVNLTLGGYAGAAPLNADLDEVAVYNRPLSTADIRGHYWGCLDIPMATQASYTAAAGDLGYRLRARVTAENGAGSGAWASFVTAYVSARPPVSTSRPSYLGTVEEGQTLTATNGGWDGTPPFSFEYEWERCDVDGANCSDISNATEATYVVRSDDVDRKIRVRVIAKNLGGTRSAASSTSELVPAMPATLPAFKQHWPYVAGVPSLQARPAVQAAQPGTIAIVDSGIDASRADFGDRVIEQVTKTERQPNSPGDGYGHGTAVASVAAGSAQGYVGAAPGARLVSIDVLDDDGVGNVSDVIEAADWIYENRERLGIKVVNFSLHGTTLASVVSDPLDKAVERLWHSGIVVVAAAGNYATDGKESAVPFAPGNDPFVLTVGATDTRGSFTERDDVAAPWSAWGYTRDGFAKPELVAPGRYIAAAVSPDAKLARDRPDRVVEPGYLQLSGTSFAAPVVAGTAVAMLGEHQDWTPDQVKGALMLTARPLPQSTFRSVGVGTIDAGAAAAVTEPPNPNLALNGFLIPDPAGGPTPVFDTSRWTQVVETDAAWGSVAWGSAAWGSAAWGSAAWGSVAWGSAAWGSVAWGSVAWGSVAWGSVAWGSTATNDVRPGGAYWVREN